MAHIGDQFIDLRWREFEIRHFGARLHIIGILQPAPQPFLGATVGKLIQNGTHRAAIIPNGVARDARFLLHDG